MSASPTSEKSRPYFGIGPQAVMILLVLGLVGAMAIQPTRQLMEQRTRIEGMADDLSRLQALNRELEARVARLQDPDYIEQEARDKAGLVMPGETTYVVMPPSHRGRPDRTAPQLPSADAPPSEPAFLEGFLEFIGVD
jgi:cell division protein FtsB